MYHKICEQVVQMHEQLRIAWPHLTRIAIAIYDEDNDDLYTFVHSTCSEIPFSKYSKKLSAMPTLVEVAESGIPRIIDEISLFINEGHPEAEILEQVGFRSSFTVPFYRHQKKLFGFIFYDADEKSFFTPYIRSHLEIYSELIKSLIIADAMPLHVVQGAVNLSQTMAKFKDQETGEHIARMAHYAKLIAMKHTDERVNDVFIHYVLLYAPLHDIGKIGIPDKILLKNGSLEREERIIMESHVDKGIEIVENLLWEFDLNHLEHVSILRNIVTYHHERMDGNGYPFRLKGEQIPLESRIASIADVFDALTSKRPYREAWPIEKAYAYLRENAGKQFDTECVNIFLKSDEEIKQIIKLFDENGVKHG